MQTHKHRLIDQRLTSLGYPPLRTRVEDLRGRGISWRAIATGVAAATNLEVSDTNLIDWFGEVDE